MGIAGFFLPKIGGKYEALDRNKEKLRERNDVPTAWKPSTNNNNTQLFFNWYYV